MSLGIYEAEPAGNMSGAFLWVAATLRFQGKQRPFHQTAQAAGKLLSQLCHCQLGLQWLSPLFFSCLHISPHLFSGLGCFTPASFPTHFPSVTLLTCSDSSSRHWSKTQRSDIGEASQLLQKALLFLPGYFGMSNPTSQAEMLRAVTYLPLMCLVHLPSLSEP